MNFDVTACNRLLLESLIKAIDHSEDKIRAIAESEQANGKCNIDGLSFDVLPWHSTLDITFRNSQDETEGAGRYRYSPADWKYYDYLDCESAFDDAVDFTTELYESVEVPQKAEMMHLLYLSAAEALLDHQVANRLGALGIDAPLVSNSFRTSNFEYMVIDEDRVIRANYCEIILANRIADRLRADAV